MIAVGRKTHLRFAGIFWTLAGFGLLTRGVLLLQPLHHWWLMVPASLLGLGKSFLMIDRSVERVVRRVEGFEQEKCLGAVFTPFTWLMIGAMITLGILLKYTGIYDGIRGFILVTIGMALLISSRIVWRAVKKAALQ